MINQYILKCNNEAIQIQVVYSSRKTLGLQIKADGTVYMRSPRRVPDKMIEQFIMKNRDWIASKRTEILKRDNSGVTVLPEVNKAQDKSEIRKKVAGKVDYYANIMNVSYNRVTLRNQKTRWGSCSSRGNLNFNYRLLYLPEELVDYVVLHELSHRVYMNHSNDFWNLVKKYMPDYKVRRQELKQYRLL